MKTYTKTIEKPRLEIRYDSNSESPRNWTNLGYFITCDRDYKSPDSDSGLEYLIKATGAEAESLAEHIELIKKGFETYSYGKIIAIYPITKYEHSGISYSLGTAHGFDNSNNGFYIITDKTEKEYYGVKSKIKNRQYKKVIEQELENYNKWINSEIYCFQLYDKNGEEEDSCWGFYSLDEIKAELPKEWKNENMQDYLF